MPVATVNARLPPADSHGWRLESSYPCFFLPVAPRSLRPCVAFCPPGSRITSVPFDRYYSVNFQISLLSDCVTSAHPDGPLATSSDASIASVMQLLKTQRTGAVLVCEKDKLVGVFTERDALKQMREKSDLSRPVREVMSSNPITVSPQSSVGEAIHKMSSGGYRHLPIVDAQGRASGVVAVRGIVHYLVEHFPATIYNLPPNAEGAPAEREGA